MGDFNTCSNLLPNIGKLKLDYIQKCIHNIQKFAKITQL